MPDVTPIYGLPFPESADAADVAGDMQALAERSEAVLAAGIRSSGKSIISAEQAINSTTFALAGTPDRVEEIVLPNDGLIFVLYRALAKNDTGGAGGYAAIFLDEVQLKTPAVSGAPVVSDVYIDDPDYSWLTTRPRGLHISDATTAASDGVSTGLAVSDPTTGDAALCVIEAAAGTYNVSVRFKAAASDKPITVKDRRLRVWSQAFGMPPA
jgi:hypothetical protein